MLYIQQSLYSLRSPDVATVRQQYISVESISVAASRPLRLVPGVDAVALQFAGVSNLVAFFATMSSGPRLLRI